MSPEDIVAMAVKLLDLVVSLVGKGHTAALLTQNQVERANAIADAAQYVKFHQKPNNSSDA
jgi:hypothetical protein